MKWRGVRRVTPNPSFYLFFESISQPVSRVLEGTILANGT